jgi:hypothetical protein
MKLSIGERVIPRSMLPYICVLFSCCTSPLFSQPSPNDQLWDDEFGVPGIEVLGALSSFINHHGKTYISGSFESIAGISATNLAVWDDGHWQSADVPMTEGFAKFIPYRNGFLGFGGIGFEPPQPRIGGVAYWDGKQWTNITGLLTAPYPGVGVRDVLAVGDDVYVCGYFATIGGVPAQNIARWDGQKWNALGDGIELALAQGEEGKFVAQLVTHLISFQNSIYAAGYFNWAGGKRANNIARWDGTNWYPLAEGTRYARNDPLGTDNGRVRALTIHQDQLIVAGSFQLAGEVHASGIARWDGVDWHSLEPGFPPGSALAIASNGDSLFVGGLFENRCVPECSSYLTRWDGSRWSPLGQGVLGSVFLLGVDNDHLFASGDFAFAGGKPSRQMALWHLPITLASELTSKGLSISWPANRNYVALERASSLQAGVWETVEFIPELRDGKRIAALPLSEANTFYRLRQK